MMGILHGPSETLWTTTIKVGLTDLLMTGSDTGDRLPPTAGQTGSVRGQCWHVLLRQLLWVIRRVRRFLLPLPSTNFHLTAPLHSLINAGEITVSARLSRTYDWLAIVCRNPQRHLCWVISLSLPHPALQDARLFSTWAKLSIDL